MYDCINEFDPCFDVDDYEACFCTLVAQPTMLQRVVKAQKNDENLEGMRSQIITGKALEWGSIHANSGIYFLNKLCVPNDA